MPPKPPESRSLVPSDLGEQSNLSIGQINDFSKELLSPGDGPNALKPKDSSKPLFNQDIWKMPSPQVSVDARPVSPGTEVDDRFKYTEQLANEIIKQRYLNGVYKGQFEELRGQFKNLQINGFRPRLNQDIWNMPPPKVSVDARPVSPRSQVDDRFKYTEQLANEIIEQRYRYGVYKSQFEELRGQFEKMQVIGGRDSYAKQRIEELRGQFENMQVIGDSDGYAKRRANIVSFIEKYARNANELKSEVGRFKGIIKDIEDANAKSKVQKLQSKFRGIFPKRDDNSNKKEKPLKKGKEKIILHERERDVHNAEPSVSLSDYKAYLRDTEKKLAVAKDVLNDARSALRHIESESLLW